MSYTRLPFEELQFIETKTNYKKYTCIRKVNQSIPVFLKVEIRKKSIFYTMIIVINLVIILYKQSAVY